MDEPVAIEHEPPKRRRRAGRWITVAVLVAFVALLLWATLVAGAGRALVSRVAAGEMPQAPDFTLEVIWPPSGEGADVTASLADGLLSLDEVAGRPVVLNFWASWCIPCRDEAPILNEAYDARRDDVVFVGVNVQDLRSDARSFLGEFDVPYPSVRDEEDKTFDAYGLTGVPETYYIDVAGRIVGHTPGPITEEALAAGIERALAGAGSSVRGT